MNTFSIRPSQPSIDVRIPAAASAGEHRTGELAALVGV